MGFALELFNGHCAVDSQVYNIVHRPKINRRGILCALPLGGRKDRLCSMKPYTSEINYTTASFTPIECVQLLTCGWCACIARLRRLTMAPAETAAGRVAVGSWTANHAAHVATTTNSHRSTSAHVLTYQQFVTCVSRLHLPDDMFPFLCVCDTLLSQRKCHGQHFCEGDFLLQESHSIGYCRGCNSLWFASICLKTTHRCAAWANLQIAGVMVLHLSYATLRIKIVNEYFTVFCELFLFLIVVVDWRMLRSSKNLSESQLGEGLCLRYNSIGRFSLCFV